MEEGSQVEGVTFSAAYTRPCSREQAETLAQTYHVPTIHHDVDAFLADPTMDTVYIALPNSLHYTYAKRALEAGKHVILEKPFTPTRAQAVRLAALAREKQLFLLEAITVPHLSNVKQAQNLLPGWGSCPWCSAIIPSTPAGTICSKRGS